MHSDYGTLEWGDMRGMTAGFAGALDAFLRDLDRRCAAGSPW